MAVTSGGIRNPTQDTTTKRPDGKQQMYRYFSTCRDNRISNPRIQVMYRLFNTYMTKPRRQKADIQIIRNVPKPKKENVDVHIACADISKPRGQVLVNVQIFQHVPRFQNKKNTKMF